MKLGVVLAVCALLPAGAAQAQTDADCPTAFASVVVPFEPGAEPWDYRNSTPMNPGGSYVRFELQEIFSPEGEVTYAMANLIRVDKGVVLEVSVQGDHMGLLSAPLPDGGFVGTQRTGWFYPGTVVEPGSHLRHVTAIWGRTFAQSPELSLDGPSIPMVEESCGPAKHARIADLSLASATVGAPSVGGLGGGTFATTGHAVALYWLVGGTGTVRQPEGAPWRAYPNQPSGVIGDVSGTWRVALDAAEDEADMPVFWLLDLPTYDQMMATIA